MQYEIRKHALPTYYRRASTSHAQPFTVSKSCYLGSEPITALHYHNALEIGLCTLGNGETHIGDRIYRHSEGCILVARAYQPHLSTTSENSAGEWTWITIDPQILLSSVGMTDPETALNLIRECGRVTGVFERGEHKILEDAVNRLITVVNRRDAYSNFSASLAAAEVLVTLATLSKEIGERDGKTAENIHYTAILPAIEYVSAHLDESENLSEPSLAEMCHMSVSNLRRLFNLAAGISPKAFIVRSRMAYAEHLLRRTDLTVLEISLRVGYGEVSGFNRVFLRHFGVSPSKYRRAFGYKS